MGEGGVIDVTGSGYLLAEDGACEVRQMRWLGTQGDRWIYIRKRCRKRDQTGRQSRDTGRCAATDEIGEVYCRLIDKTVSDR